MLAATAHTEVEVRSHSQRDTGFFERGAVWCYLLRALRADDTDKALRQDAVQCRAQRVRVHAHMHEAAEHVEHAVGVDGSEHQVTREG